MSYAATATSSRTITAFFDSRTDADEAVEALVSAGVSRSGIKVVAGQESSTTSSTTTSRLDDNDGGFWDTLKDLFMPDEDRYTYAEGLRRGGYLVTVSTDEANYDTALDILDDEGTIDIAERESAWRSEGWSGYSGASRAEGATAGLREDRTLTSRAEDTTLGSRIDTGFSAGGKTVRDTTVRDMTAGDTTSRSVETGGEEVIPVMEEELRVGKRDVSHGRVRVRSYVVETPVSEQVTLRQESVNIERRPVDRALTGDERLFQDRTIEVEERSEEAVVSKDARVREELVINKDVAQRTETVSDTVRRTEVEVDDDRGTRLSTDRDVTVDGDVMIERDVTLDRDYKR